MSPAIDRAHLYRYTAGDVALEREILSLFEQQSQKWAARFNPDGSVDDWKEAAHSLKGAARGIGAWALAELCEAAEALATDCASADRRNIMRELNDVLNAVVAQAREWRLSLTPES
ncbi:MAG: hypothetical protein Tsb0010_15770 [Parvularculaceae bacterium]